MFRCAIAWMFLGLVACGATANGGGGTASDSAAAKDAAVETAAADAPDAAADAAANDAGPADAPPTDSLPNDGGQADAAKLDVGNDGATSDSAANDIGLSDIVANDSGGSDVSKDAGGSDMAKVDSANDSGPSGSCSGSGSVNCAMGGANSFPVWSDTCKVDSDCAVAQHQINCCGTNVALGINVCAKDKFAAAEATCQGQYPGCGCASFATLAQDGFSAFGADDIFGAKCTAGLCQSYVKAAKIDCKIGEPGFPKLFKYCQIDSDCATVTHQKDCCGTEVVYGIHKAAKDNYDIAEIACKIPAACDCMAQPTAAEDGKAIDSGTLAAKCDSGQCSSYVK